MKKLTEILSNHIYYILLLPVSWVLHGIANNYGLIPVKDALFLTLFYCGLAILFALLFWIYYKNIFKAGLITLNLLCIQIYFGPIQDFLKKYNLIAFTGSYIFLIPSILVIVMTLIIFLKKINFNFRKLTLYLNTLFIILIILESINILINSLKDKDPAKVTSFNLRQCPDCKKPDIYLIVADGYPGQKQLKDLLNFDNYSFENSLRKRGFYIDDSSLSNYNFTQYSVASMFSMSFLEGITTINSNTNDKRLCREALLNNATTNYLENEGYTFYNYSIFDFKKNPSITIPTFISRKLEPLTRHTFTYRLQRDLGYHLVTTLKLKSVALKYLTFDLKNNNQLYEATLKIVNNSDKKPKFVYTHLMMPHHPFYYDSAGSTVPLDSLKDGFYYNKTARISYLKYTNNKLIELIDHIVVNNSTPPIIILVSDHGVREFREKFDPGYMFMNFKAIYLPDNNYKGFYKGQSNINLFRTLLNKQFKQDIPMAKDSTILATD